MGAWYRDDMRTSSHGEPVRTRKGSGKKPYNLQNENFSIKLGNNTREHNEKQN